MRKPLYLIALFAFASAGCAYWPGYHAPAAGEDIAAAGAAPAAPAPKAEAIKPASAATRDQEIDEIVNQITAPDTPPSPQQAAPSSTPATAEDMALAQSLGPIPRPLWRRQHEAEAAGQPPQRPMPRGI